MTIAINSHKTQTSKLTERKWIVWLDWNISIGFYKYRTNGIRWNALCDSEPVAKCKCVFLRQRKKLITVRQRHTIWQVDDNWNSISDSFEHSIVYCDSVHWWEMVALLWKVFEKCKSARRGIVRLFQTRIANRFDGNGSFTRIDNK